MSGEKRGGEEIQFSGDSRDSISDVDVKEQVAEFCEFLLPAIDSILASTEISSEDFEAIMSSLLNKEIFQLDFYKKLSKQNFFGARIVHDLDNLVQPLFGRLSLLEKQTADPANTNNIKHNLKIVRNYGLAYGLILEDLFTRSEVSGDLKEGQKRVFNLQDLLDLTKLLASTNAVDGNVKAKFINSSVKPDELLKFGEEILTVPGVIVNSVFNMIRNAARDRTDSKYIKLVLDREADELVLRIVDGGIGMKRQHLEEDYVVGYNETGEDTPFGETDTKKRKERKKESWYIFNGGEKSSGNGSTGYGLENLDKRITNIGGVLRVSSRRRFEIDSPKYGPKIDFTTEEGENKLPSIELKDGESTIFEIRLPITKK